MRILILGGTGMLGHVAHRHLADRHDVVSTTRRALAGLPVDPGRSSLAGACSSTSTPRTSTACVRCWPSTGRRRC